MRIRTHFSFVTRNRAKADTYANLDYIEDRGLHRNRKNYITFIGSMLKLITFDYIYITFYKHIESPLSGLFYRTE